MENDEHNLAIKRTTSEIQSDSKDQGPLSSEMQSKKRQKKGGMKKEAYKNVDEWVLRGDDDDETFGQDQTLDVKHQTKELNTMLSALGFEFANKEKKAPVQPEAQPESDVYPKTFSESKYLLFYSEQVFALASTNEAESMRENSNVLCQEILGRSQSASGIYIGAFTKDFIVVYRNIEGRLDQYYKV